MIFNLIKYYLEIIRWQKKPVEEIRKLQLNRFIQLFEYAKVRSKFYNQLYKETGVFDLKITSFKDIEKIPIIDKHILRKYNYDDILTEPISDKINEHSTSGSSGEPFKLYYDKFTDYTSHVRVFYALYTTGKYNPFKKITLITRYDENENFQVENDLSILKRFQKTFHVFEREIISIYRSPDFIIEKIVEQKPNILWGTPSVIEIVVNRMIEQNLSFNIPCLFLTSENLSMVQFQKFYNHVSKNVVDIYGSMESPCLGFEINKSGKRIIYPNSNLFEIAEVHETSHSKEGTVIITNLLNKTMPIIRYNLKDYTTVLEDEDYPNKIIGDIIGRIDDILDLPDGTNFFHHQAHEMFMDFHECEQFKFVQKKGEPIKLLLKINSLYSHEDIKAKAMQRWSKHFQKFPLEIEFVDNFKIDGETGKFKNIEKLK